MANIKEVHLPDIGDFSEVEVIEVLVAPGDAVAEEDSLLTLESDKATMEIPSPQAGTVKEVKIKVGDKVSQGDLILTLEAAEDASREEDAQAPDSEQTAPPEGETPAPAKESESPGAAPESGSGEKDEPVRPADLPPGSPQPAPPPVPDAPTPAARKAHASPSVRRFARDLGVDLGQVSGSGRKGRILKGDVQAYVKKTMSRAGPAGTVGLQMAEMPEVDFSQWGEVETKPLSRIKKLAGGNLHRNWVSIPHVTQFDEADITELEEFRKSQKNRLDHEGVKLTMLSFLIKAVVVALRKFPHFNASLEPSGENLILKKYFHIGIAVDTPDGLVVPVLRDADQKGLFQLAAELGELSQKARDKKLTPGDMQGGTFTISSLGGIGGTKFTPIINAPEVAILGVSRAEMKPVYEDGEFVPRLILPLSLSYDHRVIDGADGARFTTALRTVLSDIRHMLL